VPDKNGSEQGKKYAVVHGHFYQPPRENPWTGAIPRQESAAPFHDWNERIAGECYRPNAFARILDKKGNLREIINNFEFINFNAGPTLLHWLKTHTPDVYERILEADRKSMARNNGHGNAIAQVFNHVIMPLATAAERYTQILWGIEDFHTHFGRAPEAIWLSETAVDEKTIASLLQFDIRYIILSPFQAEKFRPLGSKDWSPAGKGTIDTTRPYRFIGEKGHLDVIFYNHAVSSGISFGPLLSDAGLLLGKFQLAAPDRAQDTLVTACVDGESFGHHKKFGEMCLAFFIGHLAPKAGFEVVNLARYLEMHPPEHEVLLAAGEENEGTSWSCTHGVSRWVRDCGCATGGYPGWHQKWRTPLRDAFNFLRDEVQKILEQELSPLVGETGSAFHRYFPLIRDKTSEGRARYLEAVGCGSVTPEEKIKIFELLEAAYFAQLTFTSCAWFFADIAGLEARQNIKYAMRGIDLATPHAGAGIEKGFLALLEQAASNMPEKKNGKEIYREMQLSARIGKEQIVANCAIEGFITGGFKNRKCDYYEIQLLRYEIHEESAITLYKGALNLLDHVTGSNEEFVFYLFVPSIVSLKCYVLPEAMDPAVQPESLEALESILKQTAGCPCYSLKNLSFEGSEKVIRRIMQKHLEKMDGMLEDIYLKNIDYLESFADGGLSMPEALTCLCEYVLTNRIVQHLQNERQQAGPSELKSVLNTYRFGQKIGLKIQNERVGQVLDTLIREALQVTLKKRSDEGGKRILQLLDLSETLKIHLNISPYQEMIFLGMHTGKSEEKAPVSPALQRLAGRLFVSLPEEKK